MTVFSYCRDNERRQVVSFLRRYAQEAFVADVQDKIPSITLIRVMWPEVGWEKTWFHAVNATGLLNGEPSTGKVFCREPFSKALEMCNIETFYMLSTSTFSAY